MVQIYAFRDYGVLGLQVPSLGLQYDSSLNVLWLMQLLIVFQLIENHRLLNIDLIQLPDSRVFETINAVYT